VNEQIEETAQRSVPHQRRHAGAHGPVGWVAAHRVLAGEPAGPAADALRALLASACAPATATEYDEADLNALLEVYRAAAESPAAAATGRRAQSSPSIGRVPRRVGRAMAVKCTGVLLVAVGTGAAAAGTDMLPASIQRMAHQYFGGLGVPGPSATPGTPGAGGPGSASPQSGGSPSPPAGTVPLGTLIALCGQVQHGAKNWRTGLDAADQAALSAAAGGDLKVTSYCAQLLATASGGGNGDGNSGAGGPGASGSASGAASPGDDASGKARGNGHDTRSPSPNPHATTANH
jgi:hypothetical protein